MTTTPRVWPRPAPGITPAFGLLVALCLALLALAPATLAQSSNRSVAWQRYDVDLTVQQDGSLVVAETQAIQFNGSFTHGFRVVPLDRTTGASNVSVSEIQNGQPVPYTRDTRGQERAGTFATSTQSDGLHIDWWFPSTSGTRTFVLNYTVSGALRIYQDSDQLQWRAIYADRAGPVAAGSVTVHLPADVSSDQLKTAWYRFTPNTPIGALPEAGTGQQTDPRTVQYTVGSLSANQGVEVRTQFPHGLVTAAPPPWQADADRADQLQQTLAPIGNFVSLLLALIIVAGGGVLVATRWYANRDPSVGTVPKLLDTPPSDLPAPLAGTLVDGKADVSDAVATLVDLGRRGVLTLTNEQNRGLLGSTSDVRATLRTSPNDPAIHPFERPLLVALFGPAPHLPAEVRLSSVRERFAASIPAVQSALYDAVAREGLFVRNPDRTRKRYQGIGVTLLALGIVFAFAAAATVGAYVGTVWLPGAALAIVGVLLLAVSGRMAPRTRAGALEAARWRAFRASMLQRAHQPHIDTKHPLSTEYLPYAVAFGIDQDFARHLQSVGSPPPQWYGGWAPGPGGVIFMPGPWMGGGWGGPMGGGRHVPGGGGVAPGGLGAPTVPNPNGWSDALADLLNAASEAMSHGGGSGGWGGGGFGGGGGGGGGSGGFN